MTTFELECLFFFLSLLALCSFGYQLNKYINQGYKYSYKVFENYQHYRQYIFYLWCWVAISDVSTVV